MSDKANEFDAPNVGETLRSEREARGLTLEDVSQSLNVRADLINSLENVYANGIAKVYLNGTLRSYAKLLDLSADDIVQAFAVQCGAISQAPDREPIDLTPVEQSSRFHKTLLTAGTMLTLVCAGIIGAHVLLRTEASPPESRAIEAGAPVTGTRDTLFAYATRDDLSVQLPLTLTANTPAWLEVRGADGTIFRSRKMAAGEVYHPRIGAGWTVTARDGSLFTWHVGDVEIGPLGEAATPVFAMSVDSVAAAAKSIASPALAATGESKPTR